MTHTGHVAGACTDDAQSLVTPTRPGPIPLALGVVPGLRMCVALRPANEFIVRTMEGVVLSMKRPPSTNEVHFVYGLCQHLSGKVMAAP